MRLRGFYLGRFFISYPRLGETSYFAVGVVDLGDDSGPLTEQQCVYLIEQYKHELYRYIFKFFGDQDVADDVFQEICLKIWQLAQQKTVERINIKAWFFAVAANVCKKERSRTFRYQRRLIYGEPYEIEDQRDSPEEQAERKAIAEKIDTAVRALPPDLRTVFLFKNINEFKQNQIAQILGLSEMAISRRLRKASEMLALELGEFKKA